MTTTNEKKRVKVEGTFADPWKPEKVGDRISGVYLGAQKAEGKRGAFDAYHIKCDDGRRLSVSGANLTTIMPQIPRKTHITVEFQGTREMDKGPMKVFEVSIPEGTRLIDPFDTEEDDSPYR